jgi:hypothetical protein
VVHQLAAGAISAFLDPLKPLQPLPGAKLVLQELNELRNIVHREDGIAFEDAVEFRVVEDVVRLMRVIVEVGAGRQRNGLIAAVERGVGIRRYIR